MENEIRNIDNTLGIDHIDGNGLNNRLNNLRLVSQQENLKNTSLRSDNKSGIVGINWDKRSTKWRAYINVNGKQIHLGHFSDKEDAINARKVAEIKYKFHKNHGREV